MFSFRRVSIIYSKSRTWYSGPVEVPAIGIGCDGISSKRRRRPPASSLIR
ncbi:hypothetical protein D1AOALGA4SA_8726 [Olavius algarvensis Delta 1 endosymbiont]|nr:hypothetical protein D1AOALGA4SA_8726 [Olavius algarvensis Delta 1 endosymbiont]